MASRKDKEPSPITSKEVKDWTAKMEKARTKIAEIQKQCQHDYEVLGTSYYDDGWSQMSVEVSEWIHCKICGHKTYRDTGKFRNIN